MKIENVAVISLEDYAEYMELKNNKRGIRVGDKVLYRSHNFGNGVVRSIDGIETYGIEVEFEKITGGKGTYINCIDKSKGWYCHRSNLTLI